MLCLCLSGGMCCFVKKCADCSKLVECLPMEIYWVTWIFKKQKQPPHDGWCGVGVDTSYNHAPCRLQAAGCRLQAAEQPWKARQCSVSLSLGALTHSHTGNTQHTQGTHRHAGCWYWFVAVSICIVIVVYWHWRHVGVCLKWAVARCPI